MVLIMVELWNYGIEIDELPLHYICTYIGDLEVSKSVGGNGRILRVGNNIPLIKIKELTMLLYIALRILT